MLTLPSVLSDMQREAGELPHHSASPPLSSPLQAKMVPLQPSYSPLGRGSTTINNNNNRLGSSEEVSIRTGLWPGMCRSEARIVNRDNGRPNIHHHGVTLKWFGFFTDTFTTLINSTWYVIGLVFAGGYILSWIFFGAVWTAVARYEGHYNGTCLNSIDGFQSALLFSIETQVTIGYGNTYITNECLAGLVVLILQCVVGLVLDAVLLGLLFTKITRPRSRRKTILFSDRAVICEGSSPGERYMEFRVGNLRKSQIAECHVRLVLYWYRDVGAGCSEFQQHELECGYETGIDRIFLLTPVAIRHRIDESSPLYGLEPSGILLEDLEVVVVLEGIVEATGLTVQALWSYTNEEIVIGEKLRPIVSRERGKWVVDFSRFNEVITA